MTKGFLPFRVGLAGARNHHQKRNEPDPSCKTGGFYKNPINGAAVNTSSPLNIVWDTSCLSTSAVDIYLYAPGTNHSLLHMWQTVNYADGFYNATVNPQWWNATSPMMLQLSIVTSGTPTFLSPFPAGPVFTATSVKGQTSSSSDSSAITPVDNLAAIKKALTPGRTAAAVIMPLLVIACIIAGYIRWTRLKGKEQRKRFSIAVDKRMSTISADWKSMSAAGAAAAIRSSVAGSGIRNSAAFSFGAMRPMSTATADGGGQAGVGARSGFYTHENGSINSNGPAMSQLRSNIRTSAFGQRVSRVSFAADPRPSSESRRTVTSRAFRSSFAPPVPVLPSKLSDGNSNSNTPGTMSPTQTQGPLTLTPEDIRARIAGHEHYANPSMDEVMPALSLMRTGGDSASGLDDDNDYLFDAPPTPMAPQPPTPVLAKSPVGMMPMQPMPANVMSPDEMLRAYAERRAAPPNSIVSYPAPVANTNYNGNGMRTLYSPTTPTDALSHAQTQRRDYRVSRADSRYSGVEEDAYEAYLGTAE